MDFLNNTCELGDHLEVATESIDLHNCVEKTILPDHCLVIKFAHLVTCSEICSPDQERPAEIWMEFKY